MPRVLYQVYNHRARGPQARGRGDYKPDIAQSGHDIINIFHDFKVMFIQLNEATNHTVHVSNHGALSTFIASTVGSFEGWLHHDIYIYIYIYVCVYTHNYTYTMVRGRSPW